MNLSQGTAVTPLVEVESVSKYFPVGRSPLRQSRMLKAVNEVTFTVERGEAFGLVGESGSGKSTLARLLLGLIKPTSGAIRFDSMDISQLGERDLRPYRRRMQIVFQDTKASLNPRMRIRNILAEPLSTHGITNCENRIDELMRLVGLSRTFLDRFPHQLSGGQRQRVGVARAIALEPDLIVADEPVSSLDVSVRAQILNLMKRLQRQLGLTVILIAHDLSVVSYFCDRVAVMYLGNVVELGLADAVMTSPRHPYTQALVAAVPNPDPRIRRENRPIKGEIPSPLDPPSGCPFHTRCPVKIGPVCAEVVPERHETPDGGWATCHLLASDMQGFSRASTAAARRWAVTD